MGRDDRWRWRVAGGGSRGAPGRLDIRWATDRGQGSSDKRLLAVAEVEDGVGGYARAEVGGGRQGCSVAAIG